LDGYSRLVAFLKVVLPLSALGLLSTVFLLSRGVDPTATLPFGENEISERLQDSIVTAPRFSGTTARGQQLMVTAKTARPGGDGKLAEATALRAQLELENGAMVHISSDVGSFDSENDVARFAGNVHIETTTGFSIRTAALNGQLQSVTARSEGPVHGTAPFGNLNAGRMDLREDADVGQAHLRFTDGVKLIYDPQAGKDEP